MVFTATVFSSSLKTCQSQCEDRNLAYPLHAGQLKWNEAELRAHNYTESIGSCRHGCEDVDERESKCAEKCSEDLVVTSSCQQGCRAVLVAFLTQAQAVLIEARVNMEVHDTGMKLKWEFPENVAESLKELATADIFWFAQTRPLNGNIGWRWTSLTQGAFRNSTLSTDVTVPFEEAQNVEVRLAMSYRSQVLVSRTTQYDLPLSKSGTHLEIVGQLQLSDDRVAICYKTNQPTPKFKLTVATLDGITLNTEESIARCHMFSNLPSDNCCRASIAAIDENGIITASREIVLDFFVNKVETELISSTATKLIFTNGTHLIEMNQGMVSEIITFPLPTDDKITAIAGITENTLAIGSEKGSLWTFQMNTNQTNEENIDEEKEDLNGENLSAVIQLKTVGEMDTKITQIEVDHVQRMIYAVQHDKGILRCKMRTLQTDESSSCVLIVNNDPLNPPKEISLDPINGFIYILNSDAKVYRTEMIALNSSTGIETPENFELMKELSPSNGIFYDWQKFFLYSSLQNGTVLSMNPINEHVHLFRDGDLANFRIKGDKIYWSRTKCGESAADSVCIFVENVQRGEDDLPNKFAYESALLDYTFLEEIFIKPRIASIGAISMLVSDRAAKIAWSRLSNLPFQAKGLSWRNTTYLLKITSTDQEPIELYLDTNEYTVGVKADTSYSVQVQACSEDFCSTPIRTENTAMSDFGEIIPYVLTKSHEDGIEVFDGLGNQVEVDETIRNLDKMSYPHAFDNSTKTVYLAGDHSMGIYKQDLNDVTKPPVVFKDGLFVEMMTIMPSKSMIIIGSSYKITSYRLPTTFDYEYYSCEEPLEDCAEVMGISSDDTSGMLFFITQHRNGTVTMWESNLAGETRSAKIISSSESIRPFRKFLVVQNKIIMVTKSGHIIQTDKNLNQMNEWVEGPRVDKIVPIRYAQQVRKVEFVDDIKIVDGSKTDLVWTITPASEPGDVIFKVSIYREKMGLDTTPIMSMQTETNYTIQQSVLDVWSSAQRFDVSVTAITPWLTVTQNKTGLLAPVKPPTAPVQLRIYATQQKTVDGPRALISFFWSPPVEWNGTPFQYVVNCTKDDGSWIGGPVTTSLTHYSFAVKSGKVSCQVAAANEPTNQGQFSDIISIDSSEIKPLVKLFAIDATNSLVSINDLAHEETTRETREVALPAKLDYQALAFIGEDLYAVRKEGDSAQPVLVKIDTNHYENTVHKVSIGGDVTRIDAMTSDWVGHRLLFVAGTVLYQLPLEPFLSTSLLNPHKIMQISSAATDAKQLTYDPFKNTAYLLTKNGSLFALDLNKKTEANLALTISCLAAQTITWMQTEFTWNRASSPKIYALTWNGLLYVDLAEDYQCNEVRIDWTKFGEKGIKAISSFAISDTLFAFVTSSEMLIYGRDMVTPIPITNPPLKQILAVSQSSQPYPDRSCFELPSSKGIVFTIVNEGKTGAFLEVTKSTVSSACSDVSMPQTQYEIYFTRKNTDKVKHIRSFSDKIHIENAILDKETDYDVTVTWLNRYSPASGVSPTKSFRTGFGYPSAPRDPHAIAVSPDTVYLYWMLPETLNAPISEIKYKISQQAAGLTSPTSIAVIPLSEVVATSNISSDTAACLINPCRVKIANLRPSNEYKFWVTATHISHLYSTFLKDDEAVSMESTARTLDVPGTLRPDNVTGSSIVLRWNGLEPETLPSSLNIQYRDVGHDWEVPMNTSFEPGVATEIIPINNLLSATTYDYRFVATYTGTYSIDGKVLAYKEEYFQLTQQVRTKAGVPTIPQNVESRIDEEGWIVTWKEPISDGGSPITSYAVETRHNKTAEWEIAERGLDGWKTWWRPGKSETSQVNDLEFRIRAANIEGFGAYAYTEERKEIAEEEKSVILPYFLFVLIVLLVIALLFVLWFWLKTRRAQFVKKREAQDERNCISLDVVTNLTFSPMQPMPPDIKNELKNLPHVNKEDVIIGNVIANGAYGRVHEGIASETPLSWEKNVKVAIKTLKHNYTYQERVMFMREAILLNNVDHPNIVKELGVCLSQGSEFLLLQFMEGGNLLDYLRQSIPTENQASDLCLRDLLAIAVDVARGMNYLEKLPHVHKDLSASRCLLASKSGPTKLSMGVYSVDTKSDFENTDKIRWMAPETLKDVQFTSKSDVWAFGVLLYEIFSLGELPYGEKENRRIVTDVKNGFILTRPTYCPEKLYKLMQQCWAFDQTKRPNFATILQIFESFRDRLEFQNDKPLQMHDGHYYNVNFDVSHDSTSSERGGADSREPPSPSHLSKSFSEFDSHGYGERNTFGSMVNARKSAKSLRREKAKSRNSQLLSDDFDSNRLQRTLSVHSADTISTEFSGERGLNSPSSSGNQYLSPYDAVKSRMSAAPALGIVNNAFESSNPPSLNLSRSWTAPSENPPNGNSMDLLRTNRNRNNAASDVAPTSPSYEQSIRNRVSQV